MVHEIIITIKITLCWVKMYNWNVLVCEWEDEIQVALYFVGDGWNL